MVTTTPQAVKDAAVKAAAKAHAAEFSRTHYSDLGQVLEYQRDHWRRHIHEMTPIAEAVLKAIAPDDRDEKIRKAVEAAHAAYLLVCAIGPIEGVHAKQAKAMARKAVEEVLTELTGGQKT